MMNYLNAPSPMDMGGAQSRQYSAEDMEKIARDAGFPNYETMRAWHARRREAQGAVAGGGNGGAPAAPVMNGGQQAPQQPQRTEGAFSKIIRALSGGL